MNKSAKNHLGGVDNGNRTCFNILIRQAIRKGIEMAKFTQPDTQTKLRGTHEQEFDIFITFADDGKGGDIRLLYT